VGSLCTGYSGLDLGVLAALGGLRHIDWASIEPVDVLVAGFPCLNVKLVPSGRLPERAVGFVDDVQQGSRRCLGGYVLEQVPAGVAVGPVQPPTGPVVSQLRDRPSGPLGPKVFAPGCPDLVDRHVRSAHGVLDTDLMTSVLGDALFTQRAIWRR
jgi:hypothetical protein